MEDRYLPGFIPLEEISVRRRVFVVLVISLKRSRSSFRYSNSHFGLKGDSFSPHFSLQLSAFSPLALFPSGQGEEKSWEEMQMM